MRRILLSALLLCGLSAPAGAASYTSTKTGNWSDTAVWGGGPPVAGDTVEILVGHTITVTGGNAACQVLTLDGSATTYGALVIGTGAADKCTLTLAPASGSATCTMNVMGSWIAAGSAINVVTINPGSGLYANPGTGSTATITFGTNSSHATWARLYCPGTSAAHCGFGLASGGAGTVLLVSGETNGGLGVFSCLNAAYTDFTYLGTAGSTASTNYGMWMHGYYSTPSVTDFIVDHCTFDHCGLIYVSFPGTSNTGTQISVTNSTWTNSLGTDGGVGGTSSLFLSAGASSSGSGSRAVKYNTFDNALNVPSGCSNWDVEYNVLKGGTNFYYNAASKSGTFANNFVTGSFGGSHICAIAGDAANCYLWQSTPNNSVQNWHAISPNKPPGTTVNLTGLVLEDCVGGDGSTPTAVDDDSFILSSSGTGNVAVRNCIALPGPANYGSGGFCTVMSASPETASIEHCTQFVATRTKQGSGVQGCYVGESLTTYYTGQITSFRANLFWSTNSDQTYKFYSENANWASAPTTGDPVDYCAAANMDYNAGWNITDGLAYLSGQTSTGTNAHGYNKLKFSTGTAPGLHDANGVNPVFYDSKRCLATWYWRPDGANQNAGISTGSYMGDCNAAVIYLAANPAQIANLVAWVQAGFRPTSNAYRAASYPTDASTADAAGNKWSGSVPDIGAMAVMPPGGIPLLLPMRTVPTRRKAG